MELNLQASVQWHLIKRQNLFIYTIPILFPEQGQYLRELYG